MKKTLVALLCSLPLIANAANVGGFEFKNDEIILKPDGNHLVTMHTSDSSFWAGWYNNSDTKSFYLVSKARGHNKVWVMLSAKKGTDFGIEASKPIRSLLYLTEIDCSEYRERVLKTRSYADYFAEGDSVGDDDDTVYPWKYRRDAELGLSCAILKTAQEIEKQFNK